MKNLTKKQKAKLDKEAQTFKCLCCDVEAVKWNGERWECDFCGRRYGKETVISL
ncbi:unnamed protein product [marine sediment metagenome]|uniref:Uncharacterized protein n=1 Tax=marine sediment metagenome TaxID=412755 RepID=X1NQX0_9ZZZZ